MASASKPVAIALPALPPPEKFVAYHRVSTAKQGRSGLGLEAQVELIGRYVERVRGKEIATFTEIESGKRADRPELAKALAMARGRRAVLLVAKLDRLARNVEFTSKLLNTPGVEFRAADFPEANRLMIHILSAFAEYEREQVSLRTKAALAARKARGLKLGNSANLKRGGNPKTGAAADAEAERLKPVIDYLRSQGVAGIRPLARALNEQGYQTERNTPFHPATVARILKRLQ